METAQQRLQFVVKFAGMDLNQLRPGDWLNLRDDLQAFLYGRTVFPPAIRMPKGGGGMFALPPSTPPFPQDDPEGALRKLQEEAGRILKEMLEGRELPSGEQGSLGSTEIRASHFLMGVPQGKAIWYVEGTVREMFLLLLHYLLSQEPTDRILRCPECRTIFYRVRKQKFCCRRCANRASVRAWRGSEHGKQREAQRARERYRNRIRKKRRTSREG